MLESLGGAGLQALRDSGTWRHLQKQCYCSCHPRHSILRPERRDESATASPAVESTDGPTARLLFSRVAAGTSLLLPTACATPSPRSSVAAGIRVRTDAPFSCQPTSAPLTPSRPTVLRSLNLVKTSVSDPSECRVDERAAGKVPKFEMRSAWCSRWVQRRAV